MARSLGLFVVAFGASAALGCGGSSSEASTTSILGSSSAETSSSSATTSSGSGGSGPFTCGASQKVIAEGSITPPGVLDKLMSCTVMNVASSPMLSVGVACDDGMGGMDMITLTIMATPAITTSLKSGDAAHVYYAYTSIDGPAVWAGITDAKDNLVLGFVNAYNLTGLGMPQFGEPFVIKETACADDMTRQAITFELNGVKSTVADGHRETVGPQGNYVAQVEKASIDPSTPSMLPHYTFVLAEQP